MPLICKTTLLLAVALGASIAKCEEANDQQYYIDKMAHNLQVASIWVLENGIENYSRFGKEAIFRKLLEEWGVQQWVEPVVGGRYLALFRIKARSMKAEVLCLTRDSAGKIFEYWLITFSGEEWKKSPMRGPYCIFLISEADSAVGVRKIVHQAKTFFPSYSVNREVTIKLPLDDLTLLYDMRAWHFPESYPESDLKNWEIRYNVWGRLVRVPVQRRKR